MPRIRLKKMVGVSSGSVTCQKREIRPAPSSEAASYQLFRHTLQAGQENDNRGT